MLITICVRLKVLAYNSTRFSYSKIENRCTLAGRCGLNRVYYIFLTSVRFLAKPMWIFTKFGRTPTKLLPKLPFSHLILPKFAWHKSCCYIFCTSSVTKCKTACRKCGRNIHEPPKFVKWRLAFAQKLLFFIFFFATIYFGIRKTHYGWFGERASLPNHGTVKRRLPVRV